MFWKREEDDFFLEVENILSSFNSVILSFLQKREEVTTLAILFFCYFGIEIKETLEHKKKIKEEERRTEKEEGKGHKTNCSEYLHPKKKNVQMRKMKDGDFVVDILNK